MATAKYHVGDRVVLTASLFMIELYPDEYLRIMRARLELTQAQLANRLGVERRTISRYERGIFAIPQDRLELIKRLAEMP